MPPPPAAATHLPRGGFVPMPQQQQQPSSQPTRQQQQQQHQQQPHNQNTYNEQQELIAALKRQLEEKTEENFDLSASLAAVQVETNHRMSQVEQTNKQQVSKLQETLRRAQKEANMARSALKKQKEQAATAVVSHQRVVPIGSQKGSTVVGLQQQQQQQQQQRITRHQSNIMANSITTKTASPALAPPNVPTNSSQGGLQKRPQLPNGHPSSSCSAMEIDTQGDRYIVFQYQGAANISSLAQRLLHILPTDKGENHHHHRLQLLLSRELKENAFGASTRSAAVEQQEGELVWGLVQQCVDCHNIQALTLLSEALIWSRSSCKALVQAAGLDSPCSNDMGDNMPMDEQVDDGEFTKVPATSIRISGSSSSSSKKRQRQLLSHFASQLKRPLALSSHQPNSPQLNGEGTVVLPSADSKSPRRFWQSAVDEKFSPKQQQLASQLLMRLSESIYTKDANSRADADADATETKEPFPRTSCLRILVLLLSSITHRPPPIRLLETAMMNSVSFLEQCRREKRPLELNRVRGFDFLQPLPRKDAMEIDTECNDGDKEQTSTSKCGTFLQHMHGKGSAGRKSLLSFEIDPMLCQLCRCIGDLLTDSGGVTVDESVMTRQFVHQWRKAALASVCDMLEGKLLPFLLKLISISHGNDRPKKNIYVPPENVLASWKEWIPWFTTLIKDEPGRQLLRTQFPMLELERGVGRSNSNSKPTNNAEQQCHPNSCSAIGIVVQLLYTSVMVEQRYKKLPVVRQNPQLLSFCQTLRDQSIQFLHGWWLHCCRGPSKQPSQQISFLSLVSEFLEFYKSACTWILHQNDVTRHEKQYSEELSCKSGSSPISPEIVGMIKLQLEDLAWDEVEALEEAERKYSK